MQTGQPSRTALRVAMRRAAHQIYDDPLVFADPLAMRILPEAEQADVRARAEQERTERYARGMRAFVCARSRFAEDRLEQAIAAGVRQYVVLGAGLDTYAGRSTHRDLRIFEVDHPATQTWKRARLAAGSIHVPNTVTFVPVDFEREGLMEQLAASGFDAAAPAFCAWLGVIPYLTREAAMTTFRDLAALPVGSGVAFDYAVARESLPAEKQAAHDWLAERVARIGEPFQPGFAPEDLRRLLLECGFTRLEDIDGPAIHARYYADRADGLSAQGGLGHIACAWRD